jgi:hypothetical protein
MKTTLDLPDDLLIAAKQVAARRRATFKETVTRSRRREIGLEKPLVFPPDSRYEISEFGLPRLKKRPVQELIISDMFHRLLEDTEEDGLH